MSFLKSLKIRNKVRFKQYRNKETARRAALPARLFYIVFFAQIEYNTENEKRIRGEEICTGF